VVVDEVGGGGCVEVVVDEVGGGGRVEVVVDEVGGGGCVEVVVVAIQLTVNTGVPYPIVSTPVGLMVQV